MATPDNVVVTPRADVSAGLANDVDDTSQYVAVSYVAHVVRDAQDTRPPSLTRLA